MGESSLRMCIQANFRPLIVMAIVTIFWQCKNDDSSNSIDQGEEISPVTYQIGDDPYEKLSDYQFFKGEMKALNPVYGVLPYEPISTLFTDYAQKKRFVWMPKNSKATYQSDGSILNFPEGAILIKNFYYDTVLPHHSPEIIETRMMIKKSDQWIFANYIWNEAQSEAYLDLEGENRQISFLHNGETKVAQYQIPTESECGVCHKLYEDKVPIAVKPQSLNAMYNYEEGVQNQLEYWKEFGYLNSYPDNIETVVDWKDQSEPLEKRVRSYIDVNCAHCHTDGAHCDYTQMRFLYQDTTDLENIGVCLFSENTIPGYPYIIQAGNANRSALSYRLHSTDQSFRMPQLGRSLQHEEAVAIIDEWINSLPDGCN